MSKVAEFIHKHREALGIVSVIVFLLALSFFPLFLDPYAHKEKVCFWVWVKRELDEALHGEREEG